MNLLSPEELAYLVFCSDDDLDKKIRKRTNEEYNITYYELPKGDKDGNKHYKLIV